MSRSPLTVGQLPVHGLYVFEMSIRPVSCRVLPEVGGRAKNNQPK